MNPDSVTYTFKRRLTFSRLGGACLLFVVGVWLLAMAAAPVLFCAKLLGLL